MVQKCEKCESIHNGGYGSGRFCSASCARAFSTSLKREEINKKVADKLKKVLEPKLCPQCDKLFTAARKTDQKFCSKKCWCDSVKEETELVRTAYENFKAKSQFRFNVYDYPQHFDLSLIEKHGWYSAVNRGANINGVSRDHIMSVKYGFVNNIDPNLLAHPANCRLVLNVDNQRKSTKSEFEVNDLLEAIKKFEIMHPCPSG